MGLARFPKTFCAENSQDVTYNWLKIHVRDPRMIILYLVFTKDSASGRQQGFDKQMRFDSARARDSEGKHKKDQRMIILHWFLRGIRHVAEKGSLFIAIRPVGALGPVRARTACRGPVRARTGTPAASPRGSWVGQGKLFISSDR